MSYNLGTAAGKIIIDGSGAKSGFGIAATAANAFYGAVESKLDSVKTLGTRLTAIGTAGSVGLGGAVRSAASFEAGLSAVKAVSGATTVEMDKLRSTALRIGKDTAFSASEAVGAMEALIKAGVSTNDVMDGAADATVALAAAGGIDLTSAAEIAANALNQFNLTGKDMAGVTDLIAGAANASAIDVGDFGFSLSQAGAVANLTGLKFDDLAVAIAEMGQAGIKGSDAGTSIKTFLTNLQPTTAKQTSLFRELGLVTLRTSDASQVLAKNGIKAVGDSYDDVQQSLREYVAQQGWAEIGTQKNINAAAELGNKLGVTGNAFFDANGKIKDFAEVQQILQKALKGQSEEQKIATLETLFGSDAIRAAAVFAKEGAAGYNEMAGAMNKVKAADVAKTRLDNLNGSIEQLKGSFETMMITIGEVFLPLVRKVVDAVTFMINIFNNLPEPLQKAIAVFIGLGSAMSLFTGIAIKLAFILVPMLARFLGLLAIRQVFSIFTTGFAAMRAGTGVLASLSAMAGRTGVVFGRFQKVGSILFSLLTKFPRILSILRVAWALAFGPWGLAIAAVTTAVVLLYKKFQPFKNLVDNTGKAIKNAFGSAIQGAQEGLGKIAEGFKNGEASGTGFNKVLQLIGVGGRVIFTMLKDLWSTIVTQVVPALVQAGQQIRDSLVKAFEYLAEVYNTSVKPVIEQLKQAFLNLLPALQQLWQAMQPILKTLAIIAGVIVGVVVVAVYALVKVILLLLPYLIKLATFIVQSLIGSLTLAVGVIVSLVSAIASFATGAVNAFQSAISTITTIAEAFVSVVKGIFNLIVGILTGDWKRAWEAAKQIVSGIFKAIGAIMTGGIKVVIALVKGFITGVINFFKTLYNVLVGNSIVPDLVNAIVRWFAGLPGKILGAIRSLVSLVVGVFRSVFNGAVSAVSSGIARVMALVKSIPGRIRGAFSGAGGWLVGIGKAIIQGLINGIQGAIGRVKSLLNSVTGLIPDWKGPMSTDKKLLTKNGEAIMGSLITAFQKAIPDVRATLADVTKAIPSSVSADVAVNGTNTTAAVRATIPAQADSAAGVTVNNNWYVYNPVEEKTSTTTTRAATRRAQLGVLA